MEANYENELYMGYIKNFLQLNNKKKIIQHKKCENDLNIHFFKENRQISNKHMKWMLNIISY